MLMLYSVEDNLEGLEDPEKPDIENLGLITELFLRDGYPLQSYLDYRILKPGYCVLVNLLL